MKSSNSSFSKKKKNKKNKQNIDLIYFFWATLKYSSGALEFEMDHWNEIQGAIWRVEIKVSESLLHPCPGPGPAPDCYPMLWWLAIVDSTSWRDAFHLTLGRMYWSHPVGPSSYVCLAGFCFSFISAHLHQYMYQSFKNFRSAGVNSLVVV